MKQAILVYEHLSAGGEGADPKLMAEGAAMRDAMVAGLAACPGVAVSRAVPVGAAGRPGEVAPNAGEAMTDFVAREALAHDLVWVVAPETGGLLAAFCERVDRARWIGCELGAIRLASAKQATLAHLSRHGLSTPLDFDRAPDVTRWVVKPDDGAGALDTRLYASFDAALAEAARRRREGRPASLEPWVPGEALSLSLLCGGGAAELLSVNWQRIVINPCGTVSFAGLALDAIPADGPRGRVLARVAAQVAQALPGLRGFVGIDLVWHAQRGPVVIEVNPRLTSAFVGLAERLGRPLAAEVLARCAAAQEQPRAAA